MNDIKRLIGSFYIGEDLDNAIAKITFIPCGDNIITIDHTFVSETLRGQGIALKLVNKVVEYARAEHKNIIPQCSYAKKILTGSKEYEDVLYNA
jgi:uncharacterized protein